MTKGVKALPIWMLLLLLPLQVFAVSLGDLVVRSVPGQPLRAHIPFTLLPGENLAEVRVTLASAEEYTRRRLPRAGLLDGLGIALLDKGEGKGRVQLFAEQPWQGEAAELLLLVSWDKGQMERHYQLAAVTPAADATPVYVEVAQDETLDEIAIRLSRGSNRSYLHMMYALFLANPDAFYRGNMNNLKTGQTLRVPTSEELYALSDREVFDGIRNQYEQWQQLRESGQRGTQAGEALAGMSSEQAAGLDFSGDSTELQKRLQQVVAESEAIREENEALRQRLQALEQRMQNVAGQVLEYAAEAPQPPPPSKPADKVAATEKPAAQGDEKAGGEDGVSDATLFVAILLAVLVVSYLIYSTRHPRRWRP